MTNITNFNFKDSNLRTITIDNNPYFCVADLRNILNVPQNSRLIQDLTKGFIKSEVLTDGGKQQSYFCSEKDLYKITLRSNSKVAEPFQDWVCGEVLPQLRKTGKYEINQVVSKNTIAQKQLNEINLTDFDNYQFYYMNDILLSFPYFRYKINKDTGFPLINIEDYVKCVGFKSYSLYLLEKDLKNNKEVMEFNKLYEITTDKFKLFKDYLEQFRQAFKKTRELKILQDLNNCQVIEEYEEKPAIADYMNYIGTEKLYTATEIGSILGISGCMVGKIANRLNLKIEKFGAWFKDKSSHSIKEVQTFKYNKNIIEELRKYLNTETKLIMA